MQAHGFVFFCLPTRYKFAHLSSSWLWQEEKIMLSVKKIASLLKNMWVDRDFFLAVVHVHFSCGLVIEWIERFKISFIACSLKNLWMIKKIKKMWIKLKLKIIFDEHKKNKRIMYYVLKLSFSLLLVSWWIFITNLVTAEALNLPLFCQDEETA